MPAFTSTELKLFKRLSTPEKIQDFLNTIPINFEKDGKDTAKSPVRVLREWNAHCFEGATLGSYLLSLHGYPSLLMHLKTTKKDFDHVVAPFRVRGHWGALSKTNHAVLRYRDPVYKTIRELALSYFHEYFTDDGTKNLVSYTQPLKLTIFEDTWPLEEGHLWGIHDELAGMKHYPIGPKETMSRLRKADPSEREAGKLTEWQKKEM